MRPLVFVIFISALISLSTGLNCYQCANNEDNCNNGYCEGDWCTAVYITKNPFASTHEQRVNKSCSSEHPSSFLNDSCVESIGPSGRKLSCGCRHDYCNADKAIQQLPVQSSTGASISATGQIMTSEEPTEFGPPENVLPNKTSAEHPTSGKLKCACTKDQFCEKDRCNGEACTTEIYDETGSHAAGTGGVRIGVKIVKSCSSSFPPNLVNNAITKDTTITKPDGTTVKAKLTIVYCKDKDYCNGANGKQLSIGFGLLLGLITIFYQFW